MNDLITLKEANEIHAEWMAMPCDIDRGKLAEWTCKRWNRLPESYLSLCEEQGQAAIIFKGGAWRQAAPVQEAIRTAREAGIQTRLAWNGINGEWVEIAPY
jgi:hypothetical protein